MDDKYSKGMIYVTPSFLIRALINEETSWVPEWASVQATYFRQASKESLPTDRLQTLISKSGEETLAVLLSACSKGAATEVTHRTLAEEYHFFRRLVSVANGLYQSQKRNEQKIKAYLVTTIVQKILESTAWTIDHLTKPLVFVINKPIEKIGDVLFSELFSHSLGLKLQYLV